MSMQSKFKYVLDQANRLIIKRKAKNLVVDGRFSIDAKNRLSYWLNEPAHWRRLNKLPQKINFIGNWQLNKNYDLELNLDKTKSLKQSDLLVIKGQIISTDNDALVFEVKSHDKKGLVHIQILRLGGFWQADERNQISFMVNKDTSPDLLTLEGAWQIDKNQQIIYQYQKTALKRKTKVLQVIAFAGFWQITEQNRLTYILESGTKSKFNFRAQVESPSLYPQDGTIRYRLGIGQEEERIGKRVIYLYGEWKFSRRLGLVFQMNYVKGKTRQIEFGSNLYLSRNDELVFSLTNKEDKPVGLSVIYTHKFLKSPDARLFFKLRKLQQEEAFEGGIRIPF